MVMQREPANTMDAENTPSQRSSHALRGDYSNIGPDYAVAQPFAQ